MAKIRKLTGKTKKVLTAIGLVLIIVGSFFGGFFTNHLTQPKSYRSLSWILNLIESNYCYYDEETGKYKTFTVDDYAKAIADGLLDDYSTYYTTEEYKEEVATRKGNRYGIGVAFSLNDPSSRIARVTYNSPAERAGVKAGETITAIFYNGVRNEISTYQQFKNVLENIPAESSFTMYTIKEGESIEVAYTLKREVFVASYVKYTDREVGYSFTSLDGEKPIGKETQENDSSLGEKVAVIKLTSFEGDASAQFKSALDFMKQRGKTKLILDLRDNGGGLLSILVKICALITDTDGKGPFPVAYSIDKNEKLSVYNAPAHSFYNNVEQISVVANGNSASASESLIGAMIHYSYRFSINNLVIEKTGDKTTTFGKGIAQTTFYNPLTWEAIKLTTDYIYWPDKTTCIHGVGISASEENTVEKGQGILRANAILG